MRLSSDQLRDAYQRNKARLPGRSAGCPDPEVIARLASRDLDAGDRDRATDHILGCSDCADEYRVARSLSSWAEEAAVSIAEPAGSTIRRARTASTGMLSFFARPLFLQTAAALLLLASSALIFELLLLRGDLRRSQTSLDDAISLSRQYERQIAELRRTPLPTPDAPMPQVNVPIIDLDPRDSVRGEANAPVVVLAASATLATFILTPGEPPVPGEYGLEIVDPAGKISWRTQGLAPGPDDTFTIAVPSRMLSPPGSYHFRLSRVSKTQMVLLHDYAIQVRRE